MLIQAIFHAQCVGCRMQDMFRSIIYVSISKTCFSVSLFSVIKRKGKDKGKYVCARQEDIWETGGSTTDF
jgi:hypothetical protein